jgi:mannosyltransferase
VASSRPTTQASTGRWAITRGALAVPGLLLLVALGLRLFRLTGQSLWYDEGVSAYMTQRTFAEIASATAVDIHPPLYYWLLATWAVPFGQGEGALRSLSVLLGALMVVATWGLARALAGPAVGLAAGALLAVSPLAVQYSQEVRMYALAGLLAVTSTWAVLVLLRALLDPAATRRRLLTLATGYGLFVTALLYTHYYGTLVILAQAVWVGLVVLSTRYWRIVPWYALAGGLATLLFLPWLPVLLRQTGYYPGLGSPQPAWALLLDAVNVLSIGLATTRFGFRAGLAPFLLLAGLGAGAMNRTPTGQPLVGARSIAPSSIAPTTTVPLSGLLVLLWLLLPIAGIVVLSQTRPLYEPRFLMLVVPAWVILVGAGLVALGRLTAAALRGRSLLPSVARQLVVVAVAVVVAGLLLIPTARSLASYYFDPVYARDDYRGLAQTVTLREQPGDAIILTAPGQVEIFSYYYRGGADLFPLPRQRPLDVIDTAARLDAIADDHGRVWFVRWAASEADPTDLIGGWLEGRGRRIGASQFGRIELYLYDFNATAYAPDTAQSR